MVIMPLIQNFFKTGSSQRSTRNEGGQCSDSGHVLVFRGSPRVKSQLAEMFRRLRDPLYRSVLYGAQRLLLFPKYTFLWLDAVLPFYLPFMYVSEWRIVLSCLPAGF